MIKVAKCSAWSVERGQRLDGNAMKELRADDEEAKHQVYVQKCAQRHKVLISTLAQNVLLSRAEEATFCFRFLATVQK
jgi:hypothetical protein